MWLQESEIVGFFKLIILRCDESHNDQAINPAVGHLLPRAGLGGSTFKAQIAEPKLQLQNDTHTDRQCIRNLAATQSKTPLQGILSTAPACLQKKSISILRSCDFKDWLVWYQHLFPIERGRECLALHRRDLCERLWRQWSPNWHFPESTFQATAPAFDNPDFVDVVIHCYRFHFGLAAGDPDLDAFEALVARKPKIKLPAITLDGVDNLLKPGGTTSHAHMFVPRHEHRTVACGHNMPQEAPEAFADAILTLHGWLEEAESRP